MDVPTLLNNLKAEVTCSVCIHLYTNPKQLPCLHIFCLECLNNLARTSTRHGKIKCPICETEVAVPETGMMETLPSCFYVKNLLDVLSVKECNTSKVTCGNCDEKREEASYCFHCGKFWCKDCLNGHNILRENKEHRVLALKEFQDEDFEDVLKRPAFCQKELHEKEVLKFYCKVCEVPVCQTCVIIQHGKHDVEHLETTARAVKNNITAKLNAALKPFDTISSYIQQMEGTRRLLDHRLKISKKNIQQTVESLVSILRQKERESIAELVNKTKEAQEQLLKRKGEFQGQLNKGQQCMSQLKSLLERSTGADLSGSKTVADDVLQGLQESAGIPSLEWKDLPGTLFSENQKLVQLLQEAEIGQFGESVSETKANQCSVEGFREATHTEGVETEFRLVTRNSDGEQCYCPEDYVDVSISSPQGVKVAAETKIVDNNNGIYSIFLNPSQTGQYVLNIQVNGENIREFPPICVKERYSVPVRFIGQGCVDNRNLNSPWGVAVNELDEIFVTDMMNNCIVVFNENGEFLRSFGQHVLNEPTGICIDNQGSIFVANRGSNEILLFYARGGYITVHSGEYLREPRGISLDATGNLIVCDAGNRCVRFISQSADGKIIKTIGRGWMHMPINCAYYDNKIFVSDHKGHLIKVYNSKGRFLYEFGSHGTGDGKLNKPAGLAVDKTGNLLVCSSADGEVQVFTLCGEFVRRFGGKGKGLGQVSNPCTVAVLNSGQIVICELGNDRLQIFQ